MVEALTWPVTPLAIGWLLTTLSYRLAAWDGMSAQIYGALSGLGDIVRLIGGVWLAVALPSLVLWLWKTRQST